MAFTTNASDVLPLRGPIPFPVCDQDGNGLVSEAELDAILGERMAQRVAEGRPMKDEANAPAFVDLDANADGNLTKEELVAGQQRRMASRGMGRDRGATTAAATAWACRPSPTADIDTDGNDEISPEELAVHQQHRYRP